MAAFVVSLLLLLAIAGHSDATYCVCNSGSDTVLQKNIDYACGAGADCSAIHENGACYNPNTVRDHCNYAVNSYYQRRGQMNGSCDFAGTASVTPTAPNAASGCVYQSSPSSGGSLSPGTNGTNPGFNPNNPGGSFPGTPIGLGPTGSGLDNSATTSVILSSSSLTTTFMLFVSFSISLLISGFM